MSYSLGANKVPIRLLRSAFSIDMKRGLLLRKGKSVGYDNGGGYLRVYVYGRKYMVHQILWRLYNKGRIVSKGCVIDHVDQNPGNNKPDNLRLVTPSENKHNGKLYANSSTGVRGVHFHKGKQRYKAYITRNGKRKWLGSYINLSEARRARKILECQSRS